MPAVIVPLSELVDGQEADFFAVLSEKQELTTRDGKPYFRVSFRDAKREVGLPIWSDSPLSAPCRNEWTVGEFYKLRASIQSTNFGPQLEIRKIRPVEEGDRDEGFDPAMCLAASRFDPEQMFAELVAIAEERIGDKPLRQLVVDILREHHEPLLSLPAATRNHHAFVGGYLEHVLNVTRTCAYLADKYAQLYPDLQPPLDKDVVIAGAVLHDVGKLRELQIAPQGAEYTAAGKLVGHILLGRDMVREAAADVPDLDPELLLRLEHIIISHQNLPEWGSPIAPHTPEALLVHYADDIDAKFQMIAAALTEPAAADAAEFTSRNNPLRRAIFRGFRS